ncbi:MAG: Gfo/Idh/MocA family protein [Erysipelotrichaceae bacterium]
MKLGIIGTGLIVDTLFQFIEEIEAIEITAICGTAHSKDKVELLANTHQIANTFTDYQQFLASDSFDTVYVAVPNYLHYQFAKQALLADKNVICEKPFTTNYQQALNLEKIAKERKLIIVEAISSIHNPNFKKIAELVPSLGEIKIVSLNYTQYSSRYDAFLQGNILPAFDVNKSGGALMDLNVYNIHFVTELFGNCDKVEYYPNIQNDIDTSGILIMSYPNFKVVSIAAKDCASPFTNSVQGNKGAIYTNSALYTLTDFTYQLNKQQPLHYDLTNGMHRMKPEFIHFASIIDQKDYRQADKLLQHSLVVMDVLTRARQSANIVFADDKSPL